MKHKILILGGTSDARAVADLLCAKGYDVTTSLAGVTQAPVLPKGQIRKGGFGGPENLRAFILAEGFDAVIDATHPFALQISNNLNFALAGTHIVHLRLARRPWVARDHDRWIEADGFVEAASKIPAGARVLLTVGRKEIGTFVQRTDISGVIRCIEEPSGFLASRWVLMLSKPGTRVAQEIKLMREHLITHLVSKNSGGSEAYAKIEACAELSLPVIMIRQPTKEGGKVCFTPSEVLKQLEFNLTQTALERQGGSQLRS
jgi:precorrin-6A/cobalt-precorrin-6A reductase